MSIFHACWATMPSMKTTSLQFLPNYDSFVQHCLRAASITEYPFSGQFVVYWIWGLQMLAVIRSILCVRICMAYSAPPVKFHFHFCPLLRLTFDELLRQFPFHCVCVQWWFTQNFHERWKHIKSLRLRNHNSLQGPSDQSPYYSIIYIIYYNIILVNICNIYVWLTSKSNGTEGEPWEPEP